MQNNTRPPEISEDRLLYYMLSDINYHIMPLLVSTSLAYVGDKIAFDQLSYLSRELSKISTLISTTYFYRKFTGNRIELENFINSNKSFREIKSDTLFIWNILERSTDLEICDMQIKAINKMTELRYEVYRKCNCF